MPDHGRHRCWALDALSLKRIRPSSLEICMLFTQDGMKHGCHDGWATCALHSSPFGCYLDVHEARFGIPWLLKFLSLKPQLMC